VDIMLSTISSETNTPSNQVTLDDWTVILEIESIEGVPYQTTFLSQSTCLQRCSFLFPPLSNKFFYFYIICNGRAGECGGHENPIKTRKIGGLYFHLKRGSRPGPTKLSMALPAEGVIGVGDWHK